MLAVVLRAGGESECIPNWVNTAMIPRRSSRLLNLGSGLRSEGTQRVNKQTLCVGGRPPPTIR